ncbi:unnamed protein product [Colias eurytheme]|nr:unnamed protein product [Colias eurytheme]
MQHSHFAAPPLSACRSAHVGSLVATPRWRSSAVSAVLAAADEARSVNLPKDFQDALDIIFPSEVKQDMSQQDMFQGLQGIPGFPGLSLGGAMPQFPPLSLLGQPPMMMPFDLNSPLFPRPQLYDTHVPMMSKRNQKNNRQKHQNENQQN